jgi:hypothetical protein
MRVQRALEELKDAFKEEYGLDVNIDVWVHTSYNLDLTQENALDIANSLADELFSFVEDRENLFKIVDVRTGTAVYLFFQEKEMPKNEKNNA